MTNFRTAGYQSWKRLLFIHWRIEPDRIQRLLPDGLTVETFDDSAWVAVVPFSMERIRPWWSPPVPGISWFLETNVRTYVRHENGLTGVWFFSLDANQRLAAWVARTIWNLNYVTAQMTNAHAEGHVEFSGQRVQMPEQRYNVAADFDSTAQLQRATAGQLDHFLLERYRLFAQAKNGQFFTGEVHHEPYSYQQVTNLELTESLLQANGCDVTGEPDHVVYSPGVEVRVSPLETLKGS